MSEQPSAYTIERWLGAARDDGVCVAVNTSGELEVSGGRHLEKWKQQLECHSPAIVPHLTGGSFPEDADSEFSEFSESSELSELSESPVSSVSEVSSVSSVSLVSEEYVATLTDEQSERIAAAIERTVGSGIGHKNDGAFRFARRVFSILDSRKPNGMLVQKLGLKWYQRAEEVGTLRDWDREAVVQRFAVSMAKVRKRDDEICVFRAWDLAKTLGVPWFAASTAEVDPNSREVSLAKLVVAMDQIARGGPWVLTCRDAAEVIGSDDEFRYANTQLNDWASDRWKVLELVEQGSSDPRDKLGNAYRLIGEADCSGQSANEPNESARADEAVEREQGYI